MRTPTIPADECAFKLLTLNVLAKSYAYQMDTECPKQFLDWNYRGRKIVDFLSQANADIFCLQEVDDEELFQNHFNGEYESESISRRGKPDKLLTFWRKTRWTLDQAVPVDFDDLANEGIDRKMVSPGVAKRYLKGNVGLLVMLTSTTNPKHKLAIGNTHLYWNPLRRDVKLRQAAYFMNVINAYLEEKKDVEDSYSVLICGDLNSLPSSLVYQYITKGEVVVEKETHEGLQLLFDQMLVKVSRWIRAMGVDAKLFKGERDVKRMCQQAKDENRYLITKSRKLVERNIIGKHFLVTVNDPQAALKQIINYFGVTMDNMYSRCVLCNGLFSEIENTPENLKKYKGIPETVVEKLLKTDGVDPITGTKLTFLECQDCKKIYWWGHKTLEGVDRFDLIFKEIVEENERKKQQEPADLTGTLLPPIDIHSGSDHVFICPLKRLKSVMVTEKDMEPLWTNWTTTFKGTLDYIFHQEDSKMKCVYAKAGLGIDGPFPSECWYSDHVHVESVFSYKTY